MEHYTSNFSTMHIDHTKKRLRRAGGAVKILNSVKIMWLKNQICGNQGRASADPVFFTCALMVRDVLEKFSSILKKSLRDKYKMTKVFKSLILVVTETL